MRDVRKKLEERVKSNKKKSGKRRKKKSAIKGGPSEYDDAQSAYTYTQTEED